MANDLIAESFAICNFIITSEGFSCSGIGAMFVFNGQFKGMSRTF